jgi:hypothetical protein
LLDEETGHRRNIMIVRFSLLLALITGCGFHITGGSATGDGGPPVDDADPDGMTGMDMGMDMRPDMDIQESDSDGDSIVDSQDNCPAIANTDQKDHDDDGFGDACDHCPHLKSSTDPDGDNDGVGDACDPRPANNADRRVGWYPFDDPAEINGWLPSGTWSVAGGYLVQATKNLTGIAPPMNVNIPFVMTELVIDDPATNFEIGISDQRTTTAFECALVKNGSMRDLRARETGVANASIGWMGTTAIGDRVRLTLDSTANVVCRGAQGTTTNQSITYTTNGDPTGKTYLGTSGVEARFDYLFVVDEAP